MSAVAAPASAMAGYRLPVGLWLVTAQVPG